MVPYYGTFRLFIERLSDKSVFAHGYDNDGDSISRKSDVNGWSLKTVNSALSHAQKKGTKGSVFRQDLKGIYGCLLQK